MNTPNQPFWKDDSETLSLRYFLSKQTAKTLFGLLHNSYSSYCINCCSCSTLQIANNHAGIASDLLSAMIGIWRIFVV